jgi:hypothetical protein
MFLNENKELIFKHFSNFSNKRQGLIALHRSFAPPLDDPEPFAQ